MGELEKSNNYITYKFLSLKYNELFSLLEKDGWFVERRKGSHVIMRHVEKSGQLVVPFHAGKEVKKGLLSAILKQAQVKTNKR